MPNGELLRELLRVLMSSSLSPESIACLMTLMVSGVFDGMDARFWFVSEFLCDLVDWYL